MRFRALTEPIPARLGTRYRLRGNRWAESPLDAAAWRSRQPRMSGTSARRSRRRMPAQAASSSGLENNPYPPLHVPGRGQAVRGDLYARSPAEAMAHGGGIRIPLFTDGHPPGGRPDSRNTVPTAVRTTGHAYHWSVL